MFWGGRRVPLCLLLDTVRVKQKLTTRCVDSGWVGLPSQIQHLAARQRQHVRDISLGSKGAFVLNSVTHIGVWVVLTIDAHGKSFYEYRRKYLYSCVRWIAEYIPQTAFQTLKVMS